MEKTESKRYRFGLLGRDISYSFSKGYFAQKFTKLELEGFSYHNFDIPKIEDFSNLIKKEKNLAGLNVTIPYKEAIIPYLSSLDTDAKKIGAVNTIKMTKTGLKGYNTDVYGFKHALLPLLKSHHKSALILGTGGASKAVAFVFDGLGISHQFVSRTASILQLNYAQLSTAVIQRHTIIVNCTPLGTFPNIKEMPAIPYDVLTDKHLLFDLIYNPEKTAFLKAGEERGATIKNGHEMLALQAEKSWEIWSAI